MTNRQQEEKNWKRPAHSGFDGPTYGEVVPVGTKYKDVQGNTHIVTEHGDKIIRRA